MSRCKHERLVRVLSSTGAEGVLCKSCGAVEGGRMPVGKRQDGFGPSLAEQGLLFDAGAFFTILKGPLPSTDPGNVCAGYRLKGPRTLLYGSRARPGGFVQRLDLAGSRWGRFLLRSTNGEWMFCGAYSTRALAIKGDFG